MEKEVSFWKIFGVFAKVGAFTIGGGYAMISIIEDETVKRGWISEEEFPDIVALAQSAPGLLATNMAIFAGYKIRGNKGSIVATLGTILPPFTMILIIATLFASFSDNPTVISIFQGIRPVVVALIAAPMTKMAIRNNHTWWTWTLSIAALIAVSILKVSPLYVLITVISTSFAVACLRERKR